MFAAAPKRKSGLAYSGCKVIDGTNSNNEWIGFLSNKELPRLINPKKGFIVTANNR